jgi:hypothetical protein
MREAQLGKKHSEKSKEKMSRVKGSTIYLYTLDYQLLSIFTSSRARLRRPNTPLKVIFSAAPRGR